MQNMEQFKRNIENWSRAFPTVVMDVYKKSSKSLVSDVRTGSLSGQVLKEQTGNLKKSIKTIFKKDESSHMLLGTDVRSKPSVKYPGGFGYGAYWMEKGRDFLNPAIDKNIEKIHKSIADSLEREFAKVVR